jgi:hypothetical protein
MAEQKINDDDDAIIDNKNDKLIEKPPTAKEIFDKLQGTLYIVDL